MKTKKNTNRKRRVAPAAPLAAPLPPLAVAIGRMVEPNIDGLHPYFVRAWQAMPTIIDGYGGAFDSIDDVTADSLIEGIVDDAIAKSRATTNSLNKNLARAHDLLEQADADYWGSVHVAVADAAFAVGLALGVYVTLNGGAR